MSESKNKADSTAKNTKGTEKFFSNFVFFVVNFSFRI